MGSMVNFNAPFDQPSYVACVYCATYRALVAFMDTNVKWYDALQLGVSLCFSSISDACSHISVSSDLLVTPNSCCTHFVLVSPLGC